MVCVCVCACVCVCVPKNNLPKFQAVWPVLTAVDFAQQNVVLDPYSQTTRERNYEAEAETSAARVQKCSPRTANTRPLNNPIKKSAAPTSPRPMTCFPFPSPPSHRFLDKLELSKATRGRAMSKSRVSSSFLKSFMGSLPVAQIWTPTPHQAD